MIKELDGYVKAQVTKMVKLGEDFNHPHWGWYVFWVIFFWPAVAILAIVGFSRKRYYVTLYSGVAGVDQRPLYTGYINKNDFLQLAAMLPQQHDGSYLRGEN